MPWSLQSPGAGESADAKFCDCPAMYDNADENNWRHVVWKPAGNRFQDCSTNWTLWLFVAFPLRLCHETQVCRPRQHQRKTSMQCRWLQPKSLSALQRWHSESQLCCHELSTRRQQQAGHSLERKQGAEKANRGRTGRGDLYSLPVMMGKFSR